MNQAESYAIARIFGRSHIEAHRNDVNDDQKVWIGDVAEDTLTSVVRENHASERTLERSTLRHLEGHAPAIGEAKRSMICRVTSGVTNFES